MTLTAANGAIWGSCEFGQTIFRYDPQTGESENSCGVTNAGGEVYGMVPLDGKLYLSSYAGGDHIVGISITMSAQNPCVPLRRR